MIYYTYLHCKPDGTPFYVGKGSGRRANRICHSRNKMHQDIVKRYGKENIIVKIYECSSEQESLFNEVMQIAQMRHDGIQLANFNDGGEGSRNPSVETRAKLSAAMKGKKTTLGMKCTEETRKLLSELAKKRFENPEYKAKILEKLDKNRIGNKSRSGQKRSAEELAKLSASMKGNKNMLGYKIPEEVKKKIADSVKRVRQEKFWSSGKKSPVLQGTAA